MKINILKKLIIYVILQVFFFAALNKISPQACAQTCPSTTCSLNEDCEGCTDGYVWSCLPSGPSCCTCLYGWAGSYDVLGPIWCADFGLREGVAGCEARPTPPPPEPTSPPVTTAPTSTPIQEYWLCERPYAIDPDSRCNYQASSCVNFDLPYGLCYSAQNICITMCQPRPTAAITPRSTMDPLCTYTVGRYGINSAIGCFPTDDRNEMLAFILRWAISVAGGISFLLIVYSGFLIMGSGSNTEKVKAGKGLLTAAVTGLMVLIFSVFILDFVGLRIFKIPGL